MVLGQAAGLAFLAALSPTAMLVAAAYLGSSNPRKTSLFYLAGAVLMSAVIGVIVILALRGGGLNLSHQRTPRYGLRLGLGVLALAIGLVMWRRKPRPPRSDKKPGLIARLIARPSPVTAFVTGLLIFTPSVTFIAALQVIATAQSSDARIAVALAVRGARPHPALWRADSRRRIPDPQRSPRAHWCHLTALAAGWPGGFTRVG